jgi:hypothetical protein
MLSYVDTGLETSRSPTQGVTFSEVNFGLERTKGARSIEAEEVIKIAVRNGDDVDMANFITWDTNTVT